jgi:hypothetical protein
MVARADEREIIAEGRGQKEKAIKLRVSVIQNVLTALAIAIAANAGTDFDTAIFNNS